jgi:hypothetical protein
MISQVAVEPEVLGDWNNFQMLWGDFGVAQRRQIALFPKDWKQRVMQHAQQLAANSNIGEIKVASMGDRLFGPSAKPKFRKVNCSTWNSASSWLENSVENKPQFDAIVSSRPHPNKRVIAKTDLLKDEPPYHVSQDYYIERTASSIVDALWCLIEQSSEIILVEPNFDPLEPRFLSVLEMMIDRLHESNNRPKRFEIHTCKFRQKDGSRIQRVHRANFENAISPILPSSWKVRICSWAENKIEDFQHPRFLLTEIGGIHVDWGLDAGEQGAKTLARGLGEETHESLFKKYSSTSDSFKSESENESFEIS